MSNLTGKIRFRSQVQGKFFKEVQLVLQVEYSTEYVRPLGQDVKFYTKTEWRDAQVEDLTQINIKGSVA